MLGFLRYENLLLYLQQVAVIGLLVRFLTSKLQRTYRFFFIYLLVLAVQAAYPFFIRQSTDLYAHVYLAIEGAILLLFALIVLELYSLVLGDLRGIAIIARRYIKLAVAIAIVISFLLLQVEQTPRGTLAQFYTFESTIISSLVVFVFLLTAFLVYYPVPLSRNVIFYSIGYAFYFTSKTLALFLRNTGHAWDPLLSFALLGVSTACLIFWIFSLSAQGEQKTVIFGHKWNLQDEQRLREQLQTFNAILLRARK